jgi:protoporphyrinogen oxidase
MGQTGTPPSVLILGGGLSGAAVAYSLARAGWKDITVLERGSTLGGLAGSFEVEGRFYPLGYHHILHRDRTLLFFLDHIGALARVRWRRIRMLFETPEGLYDFSQPSEFLRFPMALLDKLRFARLMLRAFGRNDWSSWEGRTAEELIDEWGGPGVRETLFEPLTQLKFRLPCREVSAAWLGSRLSFREGAAPLGFIPGANWTKVLCDGVSTLLEEVGVQVRLRTTVARVHTRSSRFQEVETAAGERIGAELFVSTIPTEVYTRLAPEDATPHLRPIRYTGLLSAVCATRQRLSRDFYWLNLSTLRHTACGLFVLSSLNRTIGAPEDICVNFVTHLPSREDPLFRLPDDELLERYRDDFTRVLGVPLEPLWTHITRVPMYSPVFSRDYRNPPIRSTRMDNVRFAGNYCTFPSVASTGTALRSGLECADAILAEHGQRSDLTAASAAFRLRSMPRA